MSLTKCVVGSDVGGIREFIVPHQTGLLFQPDNAGDLAQVLDNLFASPELFCTLGTNARKAVLQNWDWSQVIDRYRGVYRSAALHCKKAHSQRAVASTGYPRRVSSETA
jgi:glycosyltransferase involved in cell wall biosynthesis